MITTTAAEASGGAETVVVGAGLAGLTAAADLTARGREVLVLEARQRVGGRVDTRPVPGGRGLAELGAQVLHGNDNPLLDLFADTSEFHHLGSDDMVADLITEAGLTHPLDGSTHFPAPPTLVRPLQLMDRALGPDMAERISLRQALTMLRLPAEGGAAFAGWLEQVTGIDPRPVSLHRICHEPVFSLGAGAEYSAGNGLSALMAELATSVPVHTGHRVQHIGRDLDGVRVTYQRGAAEHGTLWADTVIVTVPPPVVSSGDLVIADLPAAQGRAARTLTLVPAVAAAVPLLEPAAGDAFRCDLAHGCGFLTKTAGRRHVSVVAKGEAAPRLGELLRQEPAQLRRLVEEAWPEATTSPAPIEWHDWTADPLATGAFTAPQADAAALGQVWSTPVAGRIHIAGEAALAGPTSPFLERASRSGLRASHHIHQMTQGVGA